MQGRLLRPVPVTRALERVPSRKCAGGGIGGCPVSSQEWTLPEQS